MMIISILLKVGVEVAFKADLKAGGGGGTLAASLTDLGSPTDGICLRLRRGRPEKEGPDGGAAQGEGREGDEGDGQADASTGTVGSPMGLLAGFGLLYFNVAQPHRCARHTRHLALAAFVPGRVSFLAALFGWGEFGIVGVFGHLWLLWVVRCCGTVGTYDAPSTVEEVESKHHAQSHKSLQGVEGSGLLLEAFIHAHQAFIHGDDGLSETRYLVGEALHVLSRRTSIEVVIASIEVVIDDGVGIAHEWLLKRGDEGTRRYDGGDEGNERQADSDSNDSELPDGEADPHRRLTLIRNSDVGERLEFEVILVNLLPKVAKAKGVAGTTGHQDSTEVNYSSYS